jgi:hypothetical protein
MEVGMLSGYAKRGGAWFWALDWAVEQKVLELAIIGCYACASIGSIGGFMPF